MNGRLADGGSTTSSLKISPSEILSGEEWYQNNYFPPITEMLPMGKFQLIVIEKI
jgi:hypothetical protein